MKKTVKNGVPELWISGTIVSNEDAAIYRWYGIDAICPNDILDNLPPSGPAVIKIDSPGGSVFAGAAIYTEIMNHDGPVTIEIPGLAASAASMIAMASAKEGNTCRMSPLALMMVHNTSCYAEGDYREMESTAEFLKTANKAIISAYTLKTGKSEDEIKDMLDNETWFSASEALEAGLIDEIMFTEGEAPTVETDVINMVKTQARTLLNVVPVLSKEAIDKYRVEHPPTAEEPNGETERAQALLAIEQNRF